MSQEQSPATLGESLPNAQEVINYLNECVEAQSDAWPLEKVRVSKHVVDDIIKLLSARSATPCSLRDAFELRGTYAESLGDKREVVDDAESIAGGLRQMLLARGWYEGNPEGALGEIEHRIRVLLGEKS